MYHIARYGYAFGIVQPAPQTTQDGLGFFWFADAPSQSAEPIQAGREAAFLLHQRAESFPEKCAKQEMTREDALQIDARVLDIAYQVISQPVSFMLHPGALQPFTLGYQGCFHVGAW